LRWLALRIAMLDIEFEVQAPPELVEHLEALAGRLARATGRPRSATRATASHDPT
jgi:hypothetical protein